MDGHLDLKALALLKRSTQLSVDLERVSAQLQHWRTMLGVGQVVAKEAGDHSLEKEARLAIVRTAKDIKGLSEQHARLVTEEAAYQREAAAATHQVRAQKEAASANALAAKRRVVTVRYIPGKTYPW